MSIYQALKDTASARDWRDVVRAVHRSAGRGASRAIAEAVGVSTTTARRWIAKAEGRGGQAPSQRVAGRMEAIMDMADDDMMIADALMSAQAIDCGVVKVVYDGRDQGHRTIGLLTVDGPMQAELQQAAALIMEGDHAGAEQLISDALLGGYSSQRARDSRDILRGTLKITSFRTGLHIM